MNDFQVSNDGITWYFWEGRYESKVLYGYPFVREIKIEVIKSIKENNKFMYENT